MEEIIYIQDASKKRKATAEEVAQFKKDEAAEAQRLSLLQSELKAQEELKQSAIAKLAKLGLTEDEAKAVIGIQ
jgi:sugar-specific transcriptional regulator TrmB